MIIPRRYIPFWNFTDYTPTIPKLYWDVRSQEQRILNLFELVNKVICYADYIGTDIDSLIDMVNELSTRLDTVLDEVEQELQETKDWVNDRINGLIDEIYQECLQRFTVWRSMGILSRTSPRAMRGMISSSIQAWITRSTPTVG